MKTTLEYVQELESPELSQYYTTKQVCELLKINRATFYRRYYPLLITKERTLIRAGHALYYIESVLRFVCQVSLEDCERLSKRLSDINPYVQRKKKGKYSQNNLFGTGPFDVQ
jgi:hypothetical protein